MKLQNLESSYSCILFMIMLVSLFVSSVTTSDHQKQKRRIFPVLFRAMISRNRVHHPFGKGFVIGREIGNDPTFTSYKGIYMNKRQKYQASQNHREVYLEIDKVGGKSGNSTAYYLLHQTTIGAHFVRKVHFWFRQIISTQRQYAIIKYIVLHLKGLVEFTHQKMYISSSNILVRNPINELAIMRSSRRIKSVGLECNFGGQLLQKFHYALFCMHNLKSCNVTLVKGRPAADLLFVLLKYTKLQALLIVNVVVDPTIGSVEKFDQIKDNKSIRKLDIRLKVYVSPEDAKYFENLLLVLAQKLNGVETLLFGPAPLTATNALLNFAWNLQSRKEVTYFEPSNAMIAFVILPLIHEQGYAHLELWADREIDFTMVHSKVKSLKLFCNEKWFLEMRNNIKDCFRNLNRLYVIYSSNDFYSHTGIFDFVEQYGTEKNFDLSMSLCYNTKTYFWILINAPPNIPSNLHRLQWVFRSDTGIYFDEKADAESLTYFTQMLQNFPKNILYTFAFYNINFSEEFALAIINSLPPSATIRFTSVILKERKFPTLPRHVKYLLFYDEGIFEAMEVTVYPQSSLTQSREQNQ